MSAKARVRVGSAARAGGGPAGNGSSHASSPSSAEPILVANARRDPRVASSLPKNGNLAGELILKHGVHAKSRAPGESPEPR